AELPRAVAITRFALTTTISLLISAALAPLLGALADYAGLRKRLLAASTVLGALATAAMALVLRGDWRLACVLFAIANVGASCSFVFYDSLLPYVADGDAELDRVSSAGYALGYFGGGLLLGLNLVWITAPRFFGIADAAAAARLTFLSVALWWLLFSIPLFRRVAEPPARREPGERGGAIAAAVRRLARIVRELQGYRPAFVFLVAFLIYNDGIGTIIRMAAIYGTEIGVSQGALIGAILLVQFVAAPFTFLFAKLATSIGVKSAILLALAVYCLITIVGSLMTTTWHFYLLATLVATVQGGSQALSRSLFARLIPQSRSAEFFGFFSICEKVEGVAGPALFAALAMITGSVRGAILGVSAFFVIGGGLVAMVDVAEGERLAQAEAPGAM
ncbi:MAG TPA: MFS transporter, partial [Candidatus Kryptonia bacterium]|nr:MFS transporter [Candidatus Kryptonia bacterium]